MTKSKRYLCSVAVFLCLCQTAFAQQQPQPHRLSNFFDKHLPSSYVALAGEGTFSTFGAGISFPVYWIEDRVKVVPIFGLMWQNFVDEGFNVRPATGAKFLYYFQKKPFSTEPINSFYAGLGGMGTINYFLRRSAYDYSRAGAVFGYNFFMNRTVRLAPELFLGADKTDSFRVEIGFTLYFGR